MKSAILSAAFLIAGSVAASSQRRAIVPDTLVSRKLQRRFLDDNGNYNISLYHVNDVHAHLDQFRSSGTDCTDPSKGCYGGYARIKDMLEKERPTKKDSLLLNAGDEFQGTLFFTHYKAEKIGEVLNQLGFDAMTLGNHEFDLGDDVLGEFVQNLTFPVVCANIETDHPILNKTLVPYHIFPEHDLAVVAVTTTSTPDIAQPGENTKFLDPIASIQRTVDYLKVEEKINRIIALTHIGYEEDMKLAEQTTGVHLIIGGHSHTLLGDMEGAEGKYPTIVENKDGDEVFVVTAYRWGEYLGYIDVAYDPSGKIVAYTGAPIHLDNSTSQDPELQKQINEWRKPFDELAKEPVGESKADLPSAICRYQECLLGNVMTDAMVWSRPSADFALINAGGIRADIDKGTITRGEVLTTFPFGNSLTEITFTGKQLWNVIEGIVSGVNVDNGNKVTSFFQVSSGTKVTYNPSAEPGSRLLALEIKGEKYDPEKEYKLVTLDFLVMGGDSFFLKHNGTVVTLDVQDEALVAYLKENSPIDPKIEGRIVNATSVDEEDDKGENGDDNGSGSGSGNENGDGDDSGSDGESAANIVKVAMSNLWVVGGSFMLIMVGIL